MERKRVISVICYVLSIVLLVIFSNLYINHINNKLWQEAFDAYNNFFKHQDIYVDTEFSNTKLDYLESSNPQNTQYYDFQWNEKFSDIYQFYLINKVYSGWKLFIAQNIGAGTMVMYQVFPSCVGFRKQKYSYMYDWIPSVEKCVDDAYKFYTTNSKSDWEEYHRKGNEAIVKDFISDASNRYYYWTDEGTPQDETEGKIGTAGFMYTDYYKVFINRLFYKVYSIERNDEVIRKDRIRSGVYGFIILSLIFLPLLIYQSIIINRKEQLKNEPLYKKLKRQCNPVNFMEPYNQLKIDASNRIYKELIKIDSSDINSLKVIRKRMAEELGVKNIDSEYIEALKEKCNPALFMDPYDAEKVSIANKIYAKLMNNLEDIEALEEIEKEIETQLS